MNGSNEISNSSLKKNTNSLVKFGVRGCGCIMMLLILLCCAISIYLVVTKPQAVWNRVADFLNDGSNYQNLQPQPQTLDVQQQISGQITKVGENEIYIPQEDLTLLLRAKFPQLKDITAQVKDGFIEIFWKLDNSDHPILAEAVLKIDESGNLKVTQIGTPHIFLPDFMYSAVNNLIYRIFNQDILGTAFGIFSSSNTVKVEQMKFMEGKVYLKVLVNVSLF